MTQKNISSSKIHFEQSLNPILRWTKLLKNRKFDAIVTARALDTIERNAQLQIQLIDVFASGCLLLRACWIQLSNPAVAAIPLTPAWSCIFGDL